MNSTTELDLYPSEYLFNHTNEAVVWSHNVSELTEVETCVNNVEEHTIKVKNPLKYIKNDIFLGATDIKQNFTVNQTVNNRTAVDDIYLTNNLSPLEFMQKAFYSNAEELNISSPKAELFSEFSPAMLNNSKKIGICNKSLKTVKQAKIYKCNIVKCTESFNTENKLAIHKMTHKKCHYPNCKSILLDKTHLQIHNKEVHGL